MTILIAKRVWSAGQRRLYCWRMENVAEYFAPGTHLLKETDFTPKQWRDLIDLSATLKKQKKDGTERKYLAGRNIALVFAKTSTRTRCAFEVAAADQGASTTYLDPVSSQMGHKESVADTATVLGRFFDGIEYRGDDQSEVQTLADCAGVPVWNGLSDEWHPTQMLADALTMREHGGGRDFQDLSFAYVGDARYNMGRSLLISGAMLGCDVRIVAPQELWPPREVIAEAKEIATETGAKVTVTEDLDAVTGVDFVHTDIWVSMGESKDVWSHRVELLRPYRVDQALMEKAGPEAKFMHCLPSFHDRNTTVGQDIYEEFGLDGVEVSDQVFSGPRSIVFDQAENRLHTIKAVMVRSLGREPGDK